MQLDNDKDPEWLKELEGKLNDCLDLHKLDKMRMVATLTRLVSVTLQIIEQLNELDTRITADTLAAYTHDGKYDGGEFSLKTPLGHSLEKHKELFSLIFPGLLETTGFIKRHNETYKVTKKGYALVFAQLAAETAVKVMVKKEKSGPPSIWDNDLNNLM